jgi:hypothetical protein
MLILGCEICGKEWAYSIANPLGVGGVTICKPHYDVLMQAQAVVYADLLEREGKQ